MIDTAPLAVRLVIFIVAVNVVVFPFFALAHGEEGGMMGGPSGMMSERMMSLMHERLDASAVMDCDVMTDETFMEHGEEMMEEMMGHEDHERVEEAMEVDMADHDAMHVMMGMMESGCFGDEIGASIAERYKAPSEPEARAGSGGMLAVGLVGGVVLGFLGAGLRKKNVTFSPKAPAP